MRAKCYWVLDVAFCMFRRKDVWNEENPKRHVIKLISDSAVQSIQEREHSGYSIRHSKIRRLNRQVAKDFQRYLYY